jgi:hypothetical protein
MPDEARNGKLDGTAFLSRPIEYRQFHDLARIAARITVIANIPAESGDQVAPESTGGYGPRGPGANGSRRTYNRFLAKAVEGW